MKGPLRILNLEDNVEDSLLNKAMLSARWPDCRFVRVETQEDFLAALEQSELDVILSDYTVPGFNGREALALAVKLRPEVPFLFVSGTIGEDAAIEALKNGATDYVLKHRLMRLIPAVDRALREVDERLEHQRAEESMRQSEYKYRELFESLSDAAFLVEERSGRIIDVNRSAEGMLGRSRGEILGSRRHQFLTPEQDVPRVHEAGAESPTRTAVSHECDLIPAGGPPIHVELRETRLTLYGHSMTLLLCHEINGKRS